MKKLLLLLFTLIFTLILSPTIFAKWTHVGTDIDGTDFYIDNAKTKSFFGATYIWTMQNYNTREYSWQQKSAVIKMAIDCKRRRYKLLHYISYKKQMAIAIGDEEKESMLKELRGWRGPNAAKNNTPTSLERIYVNKICD